MRRQELLERDADAAALSATVAGWNGHALQAIRAAALPAPLAARALAIVHTSMYNAWAAYDDAARQTVHGVAVRLPCGERRGAGKTVAMAHAAHLALASRFPAQRATFDAHLAHLLRGLPHPVPDTPPQSRSRGTLTPAGIGRVQAASLLDACGQDGAVPLSHAAGMAPVCERWCLLAQRDAEGDAGADDRHVLLFFALANALDAAVIACRTPEGGALHSLLLERPPAVAGTAWRDGCDAAATEVLRRFSGAAQPAAEGSWGQALGALVFDKAQRLWQGKS